MPEVAVSVSALTVLRPLAGMICTQQCQHLQFVFDAGDYALDKMSQGGRTAGDWDGWVLYTSNSGHKYHWNHLTHESRWALDEHSTEESLRELEGGGGDCTIETGEDTGDEYRMDEFISPYAGTGLITISDAGRQNRDKGESASGALRNVTTRRAGFACNGHLGGNATGEWDPEVGRKQRKERDQWGRSMPSGGCMYSSSCSHSSNASYSGSSDDNFTSDIASDPSKRSSSRKFYSNIWHSKTRAREAFRKSTRGSHDKYRTENAQCRQTKSREGTIRSSTRMKTSYDKERRAQNRRCHRMRRHSKISGQKPDQRKMGAANDNRTVTATIVGEMTGLGRQAMANAARIAMRAVVGSWTGVTSAARKAVRTWKFHRGLDSPILPIALNKSDPKRQPRLDTSHGAQDYSGHTERASFRSFFAKTPGLPYHFLSWIQSDVVVGAREAELQGVYRGHSAVAELRESDDEVCYWVGDDRTGRDTGDYTSPPQSWGKVVV